MMADFVLRLFQRDVEVEARRAGYAEVTAEVVERLWQAAPETPVRWDPEAWARLQTAPEFVREGIRKAAERRARRMGVAEIDSALLTRFRNQAMMKAVKRIREMGFTELTFDAFDAAKAEIRTVSLNPEAQERLDRIQRYFETERHGEPGDFLGQDLMRRFRAHLKDPAADLSAMLVQVVGAVFALMEEHEAVWLNLAGTNQVALFGFQYGVGVEPVNVNVERMLASFRQGLLDLEPIWRQVLSADTIESLLSLRDAPAQAFMIPDDLWARVVFDAAVAYHRRILPTDHLLKACTSLYLGRTASFVLETQGLTSLEAEERIEALCSSFEKQKPYLIQRWMEGGTQDLQAAR